MRGISSTVSGLGLGVEMQESGRGERPVEQLERLAAPLFRAGPDAEAALAAARERASVLERAGGGSELVGIVFLADLLARLAPAAELARETVASVLEQAGRRLELARDPLIAAIATHALRSPRLLALPPQPALESVLKLAFALAPLRWLSLWRTGGGGAPETVVAVGPEAEGARARERAQRVLANGTDDEDDPVLAASVGHGGGAAVLVGEVAERERGPALLVLSEAALTLAPLLERQALEADTARERAQVEASERRLTRLGLDLHDGAIQEIAALAGDVRLFRSQLGDVLANDPNLERVLGRVDDLEARLRAIDGDLRELARSFESPSVLKKPLGEALQDEVESFRARTNMQARLELEGELGPLTASQRIALLRIVQEALSNVRDHSGAREVSVSIVGRGGEVHAEVVDDGRGFDVERTLISAARQGRLGLVGMSERVRLLGGSFDVESRPGGPTTISVTLPEWRPPDEQAGDAAG